MMEDGKYLTKMERNQNIFPFLNHWEYAIDYTIYFYKELREFYFWL